MIGIYKITNLKNGKVYIGQSKNIEQRWKQHKRLLELSDHHSSKLQVEYNKYGADNFEFEVVEIMNDKLDLNDKEMKYIKQYNSLSDGYNMIGIDSNGEYASYSKLTKRQKDKMTNEEYEAFISATSLFDCNLTIKGNTYRNRMMNKHYGYRHYKTVIKMLMLVHKHFYKTGDIIVLDVLFDRNRVTNRTSGMVIMLGDKQGTVDVWEENTRLFLKDAKNYKVEELM